MTDHGSADSAPNNLVRRRLLISGQVQGVWFRDSTQRQAGRLGVTGWVRNRRDGSVEAEVQGSIEEVDAITGFCAQGPPAASVSRVSSEDLPVVADETGFAVR